ncbi:hypothetical protein EV1_028042 [Malus domestica]
MKKLKSYHSHLRHHQIMELKWIFPLAIGSIVSLFLLFLTTLTSSDGTPLLPFYRSLSISRSVFIESKLHPIAMSGGPISQDWEPVVIRKKAPNAAAKKDEKAVNAARRSGAEIETLKKATTGANKAASSSTTLNTRKLDEETENLALFKSHKNPSKTEKVSTSNQCGNH